MLSTAFHVVPMRPLFELNDLLSAYHVRIIRPLLQLLLQHKTNTMFRIASAATCRLVRYAATRQQCWHQQPILIGLRHASSSKVVVQLNAATNTDDGSPFLSKISVNDKHYYQADEPTNVGGADLGPSPYDFLLSALGSCTVMTLRMYADRKNLPLEGVSVTLTHNKVHKKDCEECEKEVEKGKSPLFDRIERKISVLGKDLTEQERTRLLEIANKCPVHRTLEQGQVVVVSSLVNPDE